MLMVPFSASIGEYILEDLSPMTTYDLRFGCKNRVGFSPWSSGQQVMITLGCQQQLDLKCLCPGDDAKTRQA